jgi:hypothetical protein
MSELKFSCPHCDQHLQADEQLSGRQIQCPSCNKLIRIPKVPGKTALYDPQSGMTWATYVPHAKVAPPDRGPKPTPDRPGAG